MAKELKVYGGTYDGRNRTIVAAYTKKAAYEAIRKCLHVGSYGQWDQYTSDSGNVTDLAVALPKPLVVFQTIDRWIKKPSDFKALPQIYGDAK